MSHHHIEHAGARIDFELVRSRRRSLAIRVAPDGTVTVRAPMRAPVGVITRAVAERGPWIIATRERLAPMHPDVRYAPGAVHYVRGLPYTLDLREGPAVGAALENSTFAVALPAGSSRDAVREALDAWYLERAREYLPGRVSDCWSIFEPLSSAAPAVRVRMMRTRWGSLSPAGTVTLNGHLMRASSECIDAVIFHELCHLRVRGHGSDFYAELARYVPDWRRLRRELRGHPL